MSGEFPATFQDENFAGRWDVSARSWTAVYTGEFMGL